MGARVYLLASFVPCVSVGRRRELTRLIREDPIVPGRQYDVAAAASGAIARQAAAARDPFVSAIAHPCESEILARSGRKWKKACRLVGNYLLTGLAALTAVAFAINVMFRNSNTTADSEMP